MKIKISIEKIIITVLKINNYKKKRNNDKSSKSSRPGACLGLDGHPIGPTDLSYT